MLRNDLAHYSNEIQSYLTTSSGFGLVLLDSSLNITDCNLGFMRMFRPRQKPVGEPLTTYIELDGSDFRCGEELRLPCSRQSGIVGIMHCHGIRTESGYLLLSERLVLTESRALEQVGAMNDVLINMQRELVKKNYLLEKMTEELDQRVIELEGALGRVRQLEGIIPICMYCKQIRDDQDCWHKLEKYIQDHSQAEFSHGLCPSCLERHFPLECKTDPAINAEDTMRRPLRNSL